MPDSFLDQYEQYPVDLNALRAQLPNNLYWKLAAPTQDPELLKWRDEESRRWNGLFGKVQSGEATEQEIHEYFDHRKAVSEDFVNFSKAVLSKYGDSLPDRDRGLHELSIRMHTQRINDIPKEMEQALARKASQDQQREAWLKQQGK